jgi:Fe2+ transport system protein FeoA
MTLLEAAIGVPLVLERVPDEEISRLGAHGLCAGRELTVEQDAPLGGPRVVRLGSRRLSVPRSIAAQLFVRLAEGQVR